MRPNALILTGRCEAGLAASRQAVEEHRQLGDEVAIVSAGSHFINEAYALTEMGRFQEAIDLGTFGYEAASEGGHRIGRYWFALGLGRTALLAGRARMARDRLAEAARLSEEDGSEAPGRVAFSLLAAAEAWLGDRDAAVNAARTVESLPSIAHLEAEQVVGPAWTAVVTGDTRRGRELLLAAADRAAVSGCRAPEAWLRHEVARLGDAPSVVDRLEELAAVCEGALIPAYGFHARAAVRQDPEQLEEASRRFEATGALLLAAEAATSAGLAYQRARTQKAATANFARAAALAVIAQGLADADYMRHRRRPADDAGAGDRPAGCRGSDEQGHRRAALSVGADRGEPPAADLHQARRGHPGRAGRRPQGRRAGCAAIASAVRWYARRHASAVAGVHEGPRASASAPSNAGPAAA